MMNQFTVYQAESWSKRTDYDFDVPRFEGQEVLAEIEGRVDLYKLSVSNPSAFILEMGYKKVATITGEDLNEVYRVGNGFDGVLGKLQVERHDRMWSISIGDLIKDNEKNIVYIVEPFGFRMLGE